MPDAEGEYRWAINESGLEILDRCEQILHEGGEDADDKMYAYLSEAFDTQDKEEITILLAVLWSAFNADKGNGVSDEDVLYELKALALDWQFTNGPESEVNN